MTEIELKEHPLYSLCTEHQQKMLLRYRLTKDLHTSIAEIYSKASVNNVARRLQNNDVVGTLIYIIEGKSLPTKEDVAKKVWHILRYAQKPSDVARLTKILSDLMEFGVTALESDPLEERRNKAQMIDASHVRVAGE